MRALSLALVPTLLLGAAPEGSAPKPKSPKVAPSSPKAFPFPIHQKTLANGLKVVVIPTGMPNLVSLQIPVCTGSRNEVEPGKSGFAHFFEHMMFRGTKQVSKQQWNDFLQQSGASQNAYTSDDLTNYHTLFGKDDLETWIRLEADRFQFLDYPENEFKDESRAVLGEYNKNSANPIRKIFEVQRDAAYSTHTYKHTTMGFLKDIEDMPNQFQYSREFFKRWYRPDNVTVILTGDVEPTKAFALVEKHFGPWKKSNFKTPAVPQEPAPKGPVSAHVAWETPTLPWMTVAFHTPAKFSTTDPRSTALSFVADQIFGSQSELYQRLVVKEQKIDQLFAFGGQSKDPSLFTIAARVKKPEDMAYVRDLILDACAKARTLPYSAARLEEVKLEAKLGFARSLESTDAIAGLMARLCSFERDPESVNALQHLQNTITTADMSRIAQETFQDKARVITTLTQGPLPEALKIDFEGVEARAARLSQLPAIALLEQPTASPLVNLRLMFKVGSVHDPKGKEGLAELAAAMVANAGTRNRSLTELTKAYRATGSGLGAQVDKELTTFSLTVPQIKATEALDLALEQLTESGFRDEDFQRLKTTQLNALKVGLKANNDEELGKLALEARLFGEPFAHPVLGREDSVQALSLEDVKAFVKANYSRNALMAGLGGGFAPEHKAQLLRGLAKLPETPVTKVDAVPLAALSSSRLQIVTKDTRATALSFGFPTAVDRRHPDFAALWVATSHLGQHRDSTGVLYQRLREIRGLNYGNYAYLEAFPNGMFQFQPEQGLVRSQNHFQVWIRPVAPQNGPFALKGALYEMNQLISKGMGPKEFEASRTFLVKFLDHLTDNGAKRLGHDLDMKQLGFERGYVDTLKAKLRALKREDVNGAMAKHWRTQKLDIVAITKDVDLLRQGLLAEACAIPTYQSPKPELKVEDEAISRLKLDLKPEDIAVVPLEELFK